MMTINKKEEEFEDFPEDMPIKEYHELTFAELEAGEAYVPEIDNDNCPGFRESKRFRESKE
jgi:hypothetical protein